MARTRAAEGGLFHVMKWLALAAIAVHLSWRTDDGLASVHHNPESPATRLVWFLHFHKAGGSSFTDLASQNNETKRAIDPQGHSHFELDDEKLRWPLIDDVPESCGQPPNRERIDWKKDLEKDMRRGVTFVSTEHWFPRLPKNEEDIPSNVKLVAVLREPRSRLLSSYYFHNCRWGRCPVEGSACCLTEWAKMEANMYTRMLNGQPYTPTKMGHACATEYSQIPMNETHVEFGVQSLRSHFGLVLTLDTLAQRPEVAQCALQKVLGWNRTTLPKTNMNKVKQCRPKRGETLTVPPRAGEREIAKAMELNALDVRLYQEAVTIEEEMLQILGCR
ncbi:hypothetical protein ACHAXT_002838 [Thalassiosira profunda]